jgi:tetratricopeptide (TPR) repeat protein
MRAIFVLVCLLAIGPPGALARGREDPPAVAAWKQAVWSHAPGKNDAALRKVEAIPTLRVVHTLKTHKEVVEDRGFLIRALVLHTDLAIVQRQTAGQSGPGSSSTGSFLLEDGRSTGRRVGSPHWNVAFQIVVMLAGRRDADARRVALSWFRTVNALLLHWAEATLLYADLGLRYYPDDAELHLYRGTMRQMYASGRVQQFLNHADFNAGYPEGEAAVELARARTDLRRALQLDPSLAEARIRLAHVVGELGQPAEAVTLVEAALRARLPAFFQSYATLILGRNLARVGRLDEARAAFDRAAALAPTAQAPRIGLSQVALASGRSADALAILTESRRPERDGAAATEAWAIYYRVHDPVAAEQLAALRGEVR